MMDFASERCSAPKTARGMAKHNLLKATILPRPRAFAMSVFTPHSAIRKSSTAAPDIETTVRENSRNAARVVECMVISRGRLVLQQGHAVDGRLERDCTTKSCPKICRAKRSREDRGAILTAESKHP